MKAVESRVDMLFRFLHTDLDSAVSNIKRSLSIVEAELEAMLTNAISAEGRCDPNALRASMLYLTFSKNLRASLLSIESVSRYISSAAIAFYRDRDKDAALRELSKIPIDQAVHYIMNAIALTEDLKRHGFTHTGSVKESLEAAVEYLASEAPEDLSHLVREIKQY